MTEIIENCTVGMMATFPARFGTLAGVIDSIIDQVDWLFVYVNEADCIPNVLIHPKIKTYLGRDHLGDLKANGKVFPLQFVKDCYVFTLDDDFVRPKNYVERMKDTIDLYDRRIVVGVHGSIFDPIGEWYYQRTAAFGWKQALYEQKLVSLIGSGLAAFHTSELDINFSDFLPNVMVDLQISIEARKRGLPIVCIERPAEWVQFIGYEGLWEEYVSKLTHHTTVFRKFEWDPVIYKDMVVKLYCDLFGGFDEKIAKQNNFDSEFSKYITNDIYPASWATTPMAILQRSRYLNLLESSDKSTMSSSKNDD